MSSTRRTAAPRKRPASSGTAAVPAGQAAAASAAEEQGESAAAPAFDPQEAAREFLTEFEHALKSDQSLSADDRDAMAESMALALRDVVQTGSYAELPDEAGLERLLSEIKQNAEDIDGDAGEFARRLVDALAPLEQRQTKIAMEFGRRLSVDGQESALAWLNEQKAGSADDSKKPEKAPEKHEAPRATPSEVTKSRSRRLRGPPRQT